jgi:hypothetical protein
MLYLGIDNGVNGAVAALCSDGSVFRVDKTPATDAELLQLFRVLTESLEQPGTGWEVFAVLEFAQSFPKMGSSSAFNYGRGYGAMQMALHAAGIPFDIVVPRKWQAALSCLTGGDKNISKKRAEQLFPRIKITHAIADSLLIAEFCRRTHGKYQAKATPRSRLVHGASDLSQGPLQSRSGGRSSLRQPISPPAKGEWGQSARSASLRIGLAEKTP